MARNKVWDHDKLIERYKIVHNNFYDYTNTTYDGNIHGRVTITCPIHGDFIQRVRSHLKGEGCRKCSNKALADRQRKTLQQFLDSASEIHGDLYDYSKAIYGNSSHEKVIIICKIHGEFLITPNSHTSKKTGCPECGKLLSGWNRTNWARDLPTGKSPKLYLIRCFNGIESFLKIGITISSISHRLAPSRLPYNYEIINVIEGTSESARYLIDLEKELDIKFLNLRYTPLIKFDGSTECFHVNSSIINHFNTINIH